jgi:pyruvate dehydrogenase E2 component (dihydrolipoamide acetyltransferase)
MAIREVFMPALSSTMTEGKIVSWQKSVGDRVEKGETVVVVESDKADMDVESFYAGFVATIVVPAGESAPVGSTIALLAETEAEIAEVQAKGGAPAAAAAAPVAVAAAAAPVAVAATPTPETAIPTLRSDRPVVSPRARKLAKEYGVSLDTMPSGSGPNGRITADDIAKAAGKPQPLPVGTLPLPPAPPRSPSFTAPTAAPAVPGKVTPLTTLQTAVVKNMMVSLSVPTFRVGYTIGTDGLDKLYKQLKSKGVTMTALLAKAVAMSLHKHRIVNASYTDAGINHPEAINIAIAVAMPDGGLITPVLQNADKLDLYSLSRAWKDLVERARAKQLQPQEYNSGTFTISNLGMMGVDRFDAILPPGTGGILAIGASRAQVVATEDGAIAVRRQMQVNLTSDHRIIYGADAAGFLKDLAEILEVNAQSLAL